MRCSLAMSHKTTVNYGVDVCWPNSCIPFHVPSNHFTVRFSCYYCWLIFVHRRQRGRWGGSNINSFSNNVQLCFIFIKHWRCAHGHTITWQECVTNNNQQIIHIPSGIAGIRAQHLGGWSIFFTSSCVFHYSTSSCTIFLHSVSSVPPTLTILFYI